MGSVSHMDQVRPLDASQLTYAYTTTPREVPDAKTLASNKKTICTDHMIVASWNVETGWSVPELKAVLSAFFPVHPVSTTRTNASKDSKPTVAMTENFECSELTVTPADC